MCSFTSYANDINPPKKLLYTLKMMLSTTRLKLFLLRTVIHIIENHCEVSNNTAHSTAVLPHVTFSKLTMSCNTHHYKPLHV